MELRSSIQNEAIGNYITMRGGWPIPVAGGLWWLSLAAAGTELSTYNWSLTAFVTSGVIFPLALLIGKVTGAKVMGGGALTSVLLPAFISMLLFYPSAIMAFYSATELVPLILAVGMSAHWPIIGWSYGRTGLFSAHAVVRAAVVTALWVAYPDDRLVFIPLAVAAIYFITVLFIRIDVALLRGKLRV